MSEKTTLNKIGSYLAANVGSWIIEIAILSVVAFVTISEVKKTNEQTREMLTAISDFAAERGEAVGGAIDSLADEAQNIEIGGKVDIGEAADAASDKLKGWLTKDEDTTE